MGRTKVKVTSRQGQGNVKRDSQGKGKAKSRRVQGKDKVRSRQYKYNLYCNYNLMGFDIIEINLVSDFLILSCFFLNQKFRKKKKLEKS